MIRKCYGDYAHDIEELLIDTWSYNILEEIVSEVNEKYKLFDELVVHENCDDTIDGFFATPHELWDELCNGVLDADKEFLRFNTLGMLESMSKEEYDDMMDSSAGVVLDVYLDMLDSGETLPDDSLCDDIIDIIDERDRGATSFEHTANEVCDECHSIGRKKLSVACNECIIGKLIVEKARLSYDD